MPDTPTVYIRTPVHCVASWRKLFFHLWFTRGTLADVRDAIQHQRTFLRSVFGRELLHVTVLRDGAVGPVDSAMREAINAAHREFDPLTRAGALVMEGSGFGASIVRGMVAGLTLIGRLDYPTKIFPSEEPAFDWITTFADAKNGGPLSAAQIHAVYKQILAHPPSPPVTT